jgi:hypothetical protein
MDVAAAQSGTARRDDRDPARARETGLPPGDDLHDAHLGGCYVLADAVRERARVIQASYRMTEWMTPGSSTFRAQ